MDENGDTVDYEDDSYYRICVNALLRSDKGVYLDVYNVHLGLTNDSRTLAAKLISERMADSKYPSVVMGDFNCTKGSDPYNTFDETLQDCQQVAEITEKEGTEAYTYNGWKSPSSTIDFIFASDEIKPMTFDVNQETWDGNLYSDHYAIDSHISVSYTRELLRTIKSIEFNGDVTVVNDNGKNMLDAEVVATFKDGTTEVLPHDYYIVNLPDDYSFGDTPTEVVATLNGMEEIKASAMPIVKKRYQTEYSSYTGATREFRQLYQINRTTGAVVSNTQEIYCHLGAFDDAALAGKEASFSVNVNSTSNANGDINIRMSNTNFVEIAGKSNNAKRVSSAPIRLNKFMDLYINGELTTIPDDAILGYVGYANTDWSGVYHVQQNVVIKGISLLEGDNTVKFQIKKHVDGATEKLWEKIISTTNADYVDFITKEANLSSETTLSKLEILNDEIYQVGDTIANEVKVNAVYANGMRKSLSSSDYTISLLQDGVAVEGTTFVAGSYQLKVTYNNDTSITATKDIEAVTYSVSYKSSRIFKQDNRVYFELVFNSVGYKPEDFAIFHYGREIKMTGTYGNGLCTLIGDITIENGENMFASTFMSHAVLMKDGVSHMYANGSNSYGDVFMTSTSDSSFKELSNIVLNGYKYRYGRQYKMPCLQVVAA